MASIVAGQTISDLYNEVLIDTPLGPYIANCLSEEDLNELNIEIIRNTLYKAYLEDFSTYSLPLSLSLSIHFLIRSLIPSYCIDVLGGASGEVMRMLLEFEADRRSINITLNSVGTDLQHEDRRKLYPKMGLLYPEALEEYLFLHPSVFAHR